MSVYSNEDVVFLSFFSHTRWWDAERMDGCARRSLSGRCRHNWESGEDGEPDWHEKEEEPVPCFSSFAHLQGGGGGVDVFGKGVETQQGCWWRAAVPPCQCHWHVWSCLRAPGFKRMQELRLGSERATSEEACKMNDVNSGAHWEKKISQCRWARDEMKEITAEEVFKSRTV